MARTPLYKTAETEMIRRIRSGDWAVGLRLPNEFVLAEEFGVSQGTMRRALMSLEGMGYLDRKPGRGTLVADQDSVAAPPAPAACLRDITGEVPAFEVFRARALTRGADPAEADLFGTNRLSVLERTLRRDGARAGLDSVIMPEAILPALDEDAAVPLEDLLADSGLTSAAIEDQLSATVTSMSDSVALSCDRYTALLVLTRTARDRMGRPLARQTMRLIADGLTYGR
ncbi:GntR family transcriptional regulator [Roseicyclus mahoneyensis]|uniref:GntR family transcriptional regulator n=1 Tax=Roseicyclus mahoneyensis TaxID=164332 RepID=A0A316GDS7_9RHOB|nr:GntR family transcriptional regulator [Roseicyclus mahoneyensis]PWK59131.1 GntR family transcriptional regulator [Roseicyclus mahoneyensis]